MKGTARMIRKRMLFLMCIFVLIIVIAIGCFEKQDENIIRKWRPQEKEAVAILDMITEREQYSIGTIDAADELTSISFGYEYYEGSRFIGDNKCGSIDISDKRAVSLIGVVFGNGKYKAFYTEDDGGSSCTGSLSGWKKSDEEELAYAGLEDDQSFKPGRKCYIAAFASGGNMSDPETLVRNETIMKNNKKNWIFYAVFE